MNEQETLAEANDPERPETAAPLGCMRSLDCCGARRDGPFCPVCGKRLTENKYVGAGVLELQYEIDRHGHELRNRADAVMACEREYEKRIAALRDSWSAARETMRLLNEALQHARKHGIGVDQSI